LKVREELYITAARLSGSHMSELPYDTSCARCGPIIVQASIFAAYRAAIRDWARVPRSHSYYIDTNLGGMVGDAATVILQDGC